MTQYPDDIIAEKRLVTVCNKCLRACCWHGIFYCEEGRSAGLVMKTVAELRLLNREHEDYWKLEEE